MNMFGSAQPDTPFPHEKEASAESESAEQVRRPLTGDHTLEGQELEGRLAIAGRRAQYITGATGAALALSRHERLHVQTVFMPGERERCSRGSVMY